MTIHVPPAIERIIRQHMSSGRYSSEEELLLEAFQSLDDSDKELQAIELGLEQLDRGEAGVTVDEAADKLRAKYDVRDCTRGSRSGCSRSPSTIWSLLFCAFASMHHKRPPSG